MMPTPETGKGGEDGREVESSVIKIDGGLVDSIFHKLRTLSPDPTHSYTACFFRVSEQQRRGNEAAYTPHLVSIGPLHHGLGKLQGIDNYKLKCLQNFLTRFGVHLDDLVKFVAGQETWVRSCYIDDFKLKPDQFSEMILLDGIFVVELLLKNNSPQLRDTTDVIFENTWMWSDLLHDMLLIENQLPLTFIQGLLEFVDTTFLNKLTAYNLAHTLFRHIGNSENLPLTEICFRARHFVELLLYLHRPTRPTEYYPSVRATNFEYSRNATELKKAGVNFYNAKGSSLFDVGYEDGELTVPCLTVNHYTETFFRNLIALEQSSLYTKDITSYVILMDCLIDTGEDVALLCTRGIIKNELGEEEAVADLFNNLYKEVVKEPSGFYFAPICEQLNDYSRNPCHKWRAKCYLWRGMLRRDYFNSPWSMISFIAACVLIGLAIVQTICSILQVKQA